MCSGIPACPGCLAGVSCGRAQLRKAALSAPGKLSPPGTALSWDEWSFTSSVRESPGVGSHVRVQSVDSCRRAVLCSQRTQIELSTRAWGWYRAPRGVCRFPVAFVALRGSPEGDAGLDPDAGAGVLAGGRGAGRRATCSVWGGPSREPWRLCPPASRTACQGSLGGQGGPHSSPLVLSLPSAHCS